MLECQEGRLDAKDAVGKDSDRKLVASVRDADTGFQNPLNKIIRRTIMTLRSYIKFKRLTGRGAERHIARKIISRESSRNVMFIPRVEEMINDGLPLPEGEYYENIQYFADSMRIEDCNGHGIRECSFVGVQGNWVGMGNGCRRKAVHL